MGCCALKNELRARYGGFWNIWFFFNTLRMFVTSLLFCWSGWWRFYVVWYFIVESALLYQSWVELLYQNSVELLYQRWVELLYQSWVELLYHQRWVELLLQSWVELLYRSWIELLYRSWVELMHQSWVELLHQRWVELLYRSCSCRTGFTPRWFITKNNIA